MPAEKNIYLTRSSNDSADVGDFSLFHITLSHHQNGWIGTARIDGSHFGEWLLQTFERRASALPSPTSLTHHIMMGDRSGALCLLGVASSSSTTPINPAPIVAAHAADSTVLRLDLDALAAVSGNWTLRQMTRLLRRFQKEVSPSIAHGPRQLWRSIMA